MSGLNSALVGPEHRQSHARFEIDLHAMWYILYCRSCVNFGEVHVDLHSKFYNKGGRKIKSTTKNRQGNNDKWEEVGEVKKHGWKLMCESCNGSVTQYVYKGPHRSQDQLPESPTQERH